MNQALINELRAHAIKIQIEMKKVEDFREENNYPHGYHDLYGQLLQAKANCLNGIAVLVAAKKTAR